MGTVKKKDINAGHPTSGFCLMEVTKNGSGPAMAHVHVGDTASVSSFRIARAPLCGCVSKRRRYMSPIRFDGTAIPGYPYAAAGINGIAPTRNRIRDNVHGAYVRKNCLRVLNSPELPAKRVLQARLGGEI